MLKVFLVEDESVIRDGLRDNIPWEQYGFRFVGEAADGEMALPLIRKARPDVLITDIKMPFMDGLSLSRIVSKEFPKMKIIIISGYDDFEYARQAIEVGVDQFLPVAHVDGVGLQDLLPVGVQGVCHRLQGGVLDIGADRRERHGGRLGGLDLRNHVVHGGACARMIKRLAMGHFVLDPTW